MPSALQKTIRRVRYGQPIVVVSGLPRSGTSMAMKMLDAGGVPIVTDGLRTADEDNPKGYFEDERVKDLYKDGDRTWLRAARGKAIKIISYLLPHLPETNNYQVVFVNRNVHEVLASQKRMLERRGETTDTSDDKMIEAYEQNLEKVRFQLRYRPCFEVIEIAYTNVLEHPREEAARIQDFLGLQLDVEEMAGVVDKSLYRNRR